MHWLSPLFPNYAWLNSIGLSIHPPPPPVQLVITRGGVPEINGPIRPFINNIYYVLHYICIIISARVTVTCGYYSFINCIESRSLPLCTWPCLSFSRCRVPVINQRICLFNHHTIQFGRTMLLVTFIYVTAGTTTIPLHSCPLYFWPES